MKLGYALKPALKPAIFTDEIVNNEDNNEIHQGN